MWTNDNRAKYDRDRLRYPSDLTDSEWAHIAPLIGFTNISPLFKRSKCEVLINFMYGRVSRFLSHLTRRASPRLTQSWAAPVGNTALTPP
ncbi:MAG: family transposase [Hyphomicrobiales bacterium]|nr:family transposase [Hyphomicrobiales bacterium]